jgi:hypothetical protein
LKNISIGTEKATGKNSNIHSLIEIQQTRKRRKFLLLDKGDL